MNRAAAGYLRRMRLLVATSNPGKLREFRQILEGTGLDVVGLHELGRSLEEPAEDGLTFEENARKKAAGYALATGLACVAEDSGLEVDALGGAPGVRSARYAGEGGDRETRDQRNNERLLEELREIPEHERTARFVCALCHVDERGEVVFETRGTFEGSIARAPSGGGGFGYDPLFIVPELGKTSAELSPEEKNARSHRGAAVRSLLEHLLGRGEREGE